MLSGRRLPVEDISGYHPLGEVVHLLEVLAAHHLDGSLPPQVFQSRLGRLPAPPGFILSARLIGEFP